jgi:hypothetical protein
MQTNICHLELKRSSLEKAQQSYNNKFYEIDQLVFPGLTREY